MQSLQDVRCWWQWRNRSGWNVKNYPGSVKGFSLNYLNLLNLINEGHLRHAGPGLSKAGWHRGGKIQKYFRAVFICNTFFYKSIFKCKGWMKTTTGHWLKKSFWKAVCKMTNSQRCWLLTCLVEGKNHVGYLYYIWNKQTFRKGQNPFG